MGVCYRRQMASQDDTHVPACLTYRPKCRAAHMGFGTDEISMLHVQNLIQALSHLYVYL